MVWAPEGYFERHLPFALLTGFLGSGKTTLLNRLLRDPRLGDTAVAINEFGAVPLDQHFVVARAEDVMVLANGCLCCFMPGDLEQSLARIFSMRSDGEIPAFKRLILETSGLADPELVLRQILDSPIASRFLWLDSVVTTVDGLLVSNQLERHAEVRKQIRVADRLIITKSDLAGEAAVRRVRATLSELNPRAIQQTSDDSGIDAGTLFSPTFFDESGATSLIGQWVAAHEARTRSMTGASEPYAHDHAAHVHGIAAVTLEAAVPLDWRQFDLWLGRLQRRYGEAILRIKGIVNVAGETRPIVVHGVQSVSHVPVALERWPDANRRSRLVVIVEENLQREVREGWAMFLADFAQGARPRLSP